MVDLREFESCDYVFKASSGKDYISTPKAPGGRTLGLVVLAYLVGWVSMFIAMGVL